MNFLESFAKERIPLPPITRTNQKSYKFRKTTHSFLNSFRPQAQEFRSVRALKKKNSFSAIRVENLRKFKEANYRLQDITIKDCIGSGKGGQVFQATIGGNEFAVKVVPKSLSKYASTESDILKITNSSLIVKYYRRLEDEQNIYLVLQLIRGSDLFIYMKRKRIKPDKCVVIAAQVLEALSYLHCLGILYRDLKPENLMIDQTDRVVLVDFGLSKIIDKDRTNTFCGSPEYMAPEIIRKTSYGFSVDFWSFGILLYELLCGHPPFQGDSPQEVYNSILCGSFAFTRTLDPTSKDLIRKLLHPDPLFRLGSQEGRVQDIKSHKYFKEFQWTSKD